MGRISKGLKRRTEHGLLEELSEKEGKLLGRFVRYKIHSRHNYNQLSHSIRKTFCSYISQRLPGANGDSMFNCDLDDFTLGIAKAVYTGNIPQLSRMISKIDPEFKKSDGYRTMKGASLW